MKKTTLFLISIILTLTLAAVVSAGQENIYNARNDSHFYATIQDAINNATNGNIIKVDTETYEENLSIDKNLTLDSVKGLENTTIKGSITIDENANVTINGFTLIDNYHERNAILIKGNNIVNLKNLVLEDTNETYWSRGIYTKADNTDLTIENVKIKNFSIGIYERINTLTINNTVMSGIGEVGVGIAGRGNVTITNSNISVDGSAKEESLDVASIRLGPDTDSDDKLLIKNTTLHLENEEDERYYSIRIRGENNTNNKVISSKLLGGINVHEENSFMNASLNYWGTSSFLDINNSVKGNISFDPWYADEEMTKVTTRIELPELGAGDFELPKNATPENTSNITVTNNWTISIPISSGFSANVTLPENTVIKRSDENEYFNMSELIANKTDSNQLSGLAGTFRGAVKFGLPNLGLTFSNHISISIYVGPGLAGDTLNVERSISGSDDWVSVTTCTVTSEGFCNFETTQASYFAAIEEEETTPTTTRRAGGVGAPPATDDEEKEVVDDEEEEVVDDEEVEEVDDEIVDDEEVEEVDDEIVDDEEEVVEEETTPTGITGLVTGFRPGATVNVIASLVAVALLGSIVYYRSYTVTGLSRRAEGLHRRADALNKAGRYNDALETRRKARKLQRKADEKGY